MILVLHLSDSTITGFHWMNLMKLSKRLGISKKRGAPDFVLKAKLKLMKKEILAWRINLKAKVGLECLKADFIKIGNNKYRKRGRGQGLGYK